MSVQQLKNELAALSDAERAEVSAFLFHLRHASDADYQATLERRLNDKDSSHWLSVEEVEKRLDEKS
jgi:hypothetical protein